MSIFTNCKVTQSMGEIGNATFEIIAPTSTDIQNFDEGSDIVIPCFDGVIFSGVITESEKTQLTPYTVDDSNKFYRLGVTCIQDMKKLKEVSTEGNGIYTDKKFGEIVESILPVEWKGDISTTDGNDMNFVVEQSDCQSILYDLTDQSGYNWRTRRKYNRFELFDIRTYEDAGYGGYQYVLEYVNSDTGASDGDYNDKTVVFISGDNKYKATGKIKYNFAYPAGGTDHWVIYITFGDQTGIGDDNTSSTTFYVDDGDYFLVLLDPVFDFAKDLSSGSSVKTFSEGKDIFGLNAKKSLNANYTKVVVEGKDFDGNKISSTLSACYEEISEGNWATSDHNAVSGVMSYLTKGEGVLYQDSKTSTTSTLNNQIFVSGHGLGFEADEKIRIGIDTYLWGISSTTPLETYSSSGDPITIITLTDPIDDVLYRRGSIVAHASIDGTGGEKLCRLYCNDTTGFVKSQIIYVGDEAMEVYSTTGSGYIEVERGYNSTPIYAHSKGTLVRFYTDGTFTVSESSPAENSPIDKYGKISKTIQVTGNCTRGDLDKFASNWLLGNSKFKDMATGFCILKDFYMIDTDAEHEEIGNVPIKVGEDIKVYYGPYSTDYTIYQLLSYTLNFMTLKVEMQLGMYNDSWIGSLANANRSTSRSI